jgi:hypothetical protein
VFSIYKKRDNKVSDFETEIVLERLQDIEDELKSTQKAIAHLKRDLPLYVSKVLCDYYRRASSL